MKNNIQRRNVDIYIEHAKGTLLRGRGLKIANSLRS